MLTGEACVVHWTCPCPHQVTLARAVGWGGGLGGRHAQGDEVQPASEAALSGSLALKGGEWLVGFAPLPGSLRRLVFSQRLLHVLLLDLGATLKRRPPEAWGRASSAVVLSVVCRELLSLYKETEVK